MTLNEFRAWLEGFEASFTGGVPNAEQWKAIKGKLAGTTVVGGIPNSPVPYWNPLVGIGSPQCGDFVPERFARPTAAAPRYADPNQTVAVS